MIFRLSMKKNENFLDFSPIFDIIYVESEIFFHF